LFKRQYTKNESESGSSNKKEKRNAEKAYEGE